MQFDLFFSISQCPIDNQMPSEKQIWQNFFRQIRAADEMGFQRAWIAESHLSSQAQKKHKNAVIPHWQGEVGLNTDILQLARTVYASTKNIELGSAIMNLLTNGGPIAHAERVATFLSQQEAIEDERKLHIGYSAGRFDFMSRTLGLKPRNKVESLFWPAFKNQAFSEASEIFLRLLNKEEFCSDDIAIRYLDKRHFKSPEEWKKFSKMVASKEELTSYPVEKFYEFENTKVVPQEFSADLLNLTIGSHNPQLQDEANQIMPVKVFNLSITPDKQIEETHQRMAEIYHKDGGKWERSFMPRTTFVFLNNEKGLSAKEQEEKARDKAKKALSAYWQAMTGTIDDGKIENATDNALVGNVESIKAQIQERFHPDDCLMLWFDFFNNNADEVIEDMHTFSEFIAPKFDDKNWNSRVEFVQR
tara:strand:+ start:3957 stop:5210 length:1254 start_codon:yes stop_codon:yes gene_type:complete